MKFARQLEDDLVPEWRVKYLNYKAGKKYIKAISRAVNRANTTPRSFGRRPELLPHRTPSLFTSPFASRNNEPTPGRETGKDTTEGEVDPLHDSSALIANGGGRNDAEQEVLRSKSGSAKYGSFLPSPPLRVPAQSPPDTSGSGSGSGHVFQLPGPAIRVPSNLSEPATRPSYATRALGRPSPGKRSASMAVYFYGSSSHGGAGPSTDPGGLSKRVPGETPKAASTMPDMSPRPSPLRRLFSTASALSRQEQASLEMGRRSFDLVRERERDFFEFLDGELNKIESFYKIKEDEAGRRLALLRHQLHQMRNQRTEELRHSKARKELDELGDPEGDDSEAETRGPAQWIEPIKARIFKPGPNSKALQRMERTPVFSGLDGDGASSANGRRDYVRRRPEDDGQAGGGHPHPHDVSYRSAKRKLKLALQEFYRGLELLKSYALLNRTAFRKLNKKYDKTLNARPPYRYVNDKVACAYFVTSEVLDGHIAAIEDLYARYFERGNHKVAAGKLRNSARRPGDQSASAFRSGLLLGTGAVFAAQGVAAGARLLLADPDPVVREHAAYLLQLYGGYALMLYLFGLFCLDCRVWTHSKISYPFIFEFDPRHHLDWRELAGFPCFFAFVLGVIVWVNFSGYGSPAMFLYYPVILIVISISVILFPAPILGHRSRKWFAYSHWRLFFAGFYPVEFRDFFLGDIYCSLTYATCNIELFFCLYAHSWDNPMQCNSSNSRLLGFFSALPPIWRLAQCLRRYRDSGNIFPHLINGGKYTMSIMAAVTLSLFRIQGSHTNMALFVTFSLINAIYCSIWDVLMDFSFLQPNSRHPLLRDLTALKQRWAYYAIMVVDPILRFSWIFYAIFTYDKQHSTIVSFLVAFAEVTRRGAWVLFRVENEHCTNVAVYKASRDVPLPYPVPDSLVGACESIDSHPTATPSSARPVAPSTAGPRTPATPAGAAPSPSVGASTGVQTQAQAEAGECGGSKPGSPVLLRRRADTLGSQSIRMMLATAHRQDFVKRRPAHEPAMDDEEEEEEDNDEEEADSDGLEEAEAFRKAANQEV